MDPENKFDEQLKEKLNQHSEQVPAHIWEKIVEEREQRKAGFWRRWTLLLLLLLTGASIYFINEMGKEHKVAPPETARLEEKKAISHTESTMPESEQSRIKDSKSKHQISNPETPNSIALHKRDLQNRSSDQLQPPASHAEDMNTRRKTADAGLIQGNNRSGSANKKNNNEATSRTNSEETQPQITTTIPELKDGELITAAAVVNSEIQSNNETAETNKEAKQQTISQAPETGAAGLSTGVAVDSTSGAFKARDSLEQEVKKDSATTEELKAMPYYKKHLVSVELYILPEYATKDLKEKSSEHDPDYLNLRNESETIDNAFSTGINLKYEINNHYFIRGGIRYSVINETFYLKGKQEAIQSIDTNIKGYIIDPFLPAKPIYEYDTTYAYKSVYPERTTHNRYTFIDIPVSAGVQFKLKQFDFYFSAGIELNLLTGSSGKIAGQNTPDSIDLSSDGTPFKKTSWSFQSGLGCAYRFSPTFDFILEPNFRKQLTSMTKNEYPLDQKYTRIGVMAGIVYKIR